MAEVFAIEFTAPVWTTILAAILLKERVTFPRVVSIAFGLVGVLVIVRPGIGLVHHAAVVVLGGSVCFALA